MLPLPKGGRLTAVELRREDAEVSDFGEVVLYRADDVAAVAPIIARLEDLSCDSRVAVVGAPAWIEQLIAALETTALRRATSDLETTSGAVEAPSAA